MRTFDVKRAKELQQDLEALELQSFALDETLLLHKPSRTLLVGGAAVALKPRMVSGPMALLCRATGVFGFQLAAHPARRLLVKDKASFLRSLERVLDWDFDRVVVGHGGPVEMFGKRELERGALSMYRRM